MGSDHLNKNKIDLEKNLEQLENIVYSDPGNHSYLVMTTHRLRKKPLKDYSIEDLRIMIGQNYSLDILMPLAIEELSRNIMAEGDFYPGDLLSSVLTADAGFWKRNPDLYNTVDELVENHDEYFESKNDFAKMRMKIESFRQINP